MKTNTAHQTQWVHSGAWLRTLAGIGLVAASGASALANDNRAPEVPDDIAVQDGNKVHFHGFGRGVQIYTWNGSTWGAAVPEATLFDDEGNVVAIHFAGPTWQSNSGSKVVGSVVLPTVTVDPNSIPWVRLRAVTPEGPGIFADTTYIQRVNTAGGNGIVLQSQFIRGAFPGAEDLVLAPGEVESGLVKENHNSNKITLNEAIQAKPNQPNLCIGKKI